MKSGWDFVNLGYALAVHAVFACFGWFIFGDTARTAALNIVIQGLGIILGFWAGVFISPNSPRERSDIQAVARTISAFISGYLLSKLDPVLTNWLNQPHAIDDLAAFRIIAFTSSFLAQAILMAEMSWYEVRPKPIEPQI
jgi:hypothetical protein